MRKLRKLQKTRIKLFYSILSKITITDAKSFVNYCQVYYRNVDINRRKLNNQI